MTARSHAALFTRVKPGKQAAGDTNAELARPSVDPRRGRMDDPEFQTQDARTFEPRPMVAGASDRLYALLRESEGLKAKFQALKGQGTGETEKALDDITSAFDNVAHHVMDIAEHTNTRPKADLFRRQAKKGDIYEEVTLTITLNRAALAEVKPLLEDLQAMGSMGCSRSVIIEDWSRGGSDGGNTTHGFDGDGPSKILDIKVSEGKVALVDQHRTPKFAPPREDQRTHLDEEVKRDMENDPDLKKEASGRLFP